MSWPNSADYQFALHDPAECFSDPALQSGQLLQGPDGKPLVDRGSFSDVYRVHTSTGDWAVKCFTRELPHLPTYEQIAQYLRQAQPPFAVPLEYQPTGIHVLDARYPIVKMRWAEGVPVDDYAAVHLDEPAALDQLFDAWVGLALELREARVSHGDMQHHNVLISPGPDGQPRLTLIDYDALVVPALVGTPCFEAGHAAFQHPQRMTLTRSRLDLDHFPLLLIATTLRGLAVAGRPLWERYHQPHTLLFAEADIVSPPRSELLRDLWKLPDPLLHFLLIHLLLSGARPPDQTPALGDLLQAAPNVSAEDEDRVQALLRGEVPRTRPLSGAALPLPSGLRRGPSAPPVTTEKPADGLLNRLRRFWRRGKA